MSLAFLVGAKTYGGHSGSHGSKAVVSKPTRAYSVGGVLLFIGWVKGSLAGF